MNFNTKLEGPICKNNQMLNPVKTQMFTNRKFGPNLHRHMHLICPILYHIAYNVFYSLPCTAGLQEWPSASQFCQGVHVLRILGLKISGLGWIFFILWRLGLSVIQNIKLILFPTDLTVHSILFIVIKY